jgi:hypothetical protein
MGKVNGLFDDEGIMPNGIWLVKSFLNLNYCCCKRWGINPGQQQPR